MVHWAHSFDCEVQRDNGKKKSDEMLQISSLTLPVVAQAQQLEVSLRRSLLPHSVILAEGIEGVEDELRCVPLV